ncbi:MAG: helix-turn-helix transcriptional regulator [Sporocytophaga sp.]|nr:helix-turn-helix transcriptional regulator [Sporocytophaga sp.]
MFNSVKTASGHKSVKLVELRTPKGWSQSDLARACNKDRQSIERIENGKVAPSLYSI